jgi:hypothetical protein
MKEAHISLQNKGLAVWAVVPHGVLSLANKGYVWR